MLSQEERIIEGLLEASIDFHSYMGDLQLRSSDEHSRFVARLQHAIEVRESRPDSQLAHILEVIQYVHQHSPRFSDKPENVFELAAAAKGSLERGGENISKIKQSFVRNLSKEPSFWGLSDIDQFYSSLIDRSGGYKCVYSAPKYQLFLFKIKYLYNFYLTYRELFPPTLEVWTYFIKHLLCFRLESTADKLLFQQILNGFQLYPHLLQILLKHFKLGIQFLRTPLNQKESLFVPHKPFLLILSKRSQEQLVRLWQIGTIGLQWSRDEVNACVVNFIKQGVTPSVYKVFREFLNLMEDHRKYPELLYAYEINLPKLFIFMKHPPLFPIAFNLLKKFILSPFPTVSLYDKFIEQAIRFYQSMLGTKLKEEDDEASFARLLHTVGYLYKETTTTLQIENAVKTKQMKKQISQYAWKIGHEKFKQKGQQLSSRFRGLTNIGNSCYLNSFIQALFMTVELRQELLTVSTLSLEQQVLKKLVADQPNKAADFCKIARQYARPLAQLQRLFALLLRSKRLEISPLTIRNVSPPEFRNTFQQDSIEFGRSLLDILYRAGFPHFFQGEVAVEITCANCAISRERREAFVDLILSSGQQESAQESRLQQMVNLCFAPETAQHLTCDSCNFKAEQSKKRHYICKYPQYAILTIKRFRYCAVEKKNKKLTHRVVFDERVSLDGVDYSLYAFVVHRGPSVNSGHYYTFARDAAEWVCFNDSQVTTFASFAKVMEFLESSPEDTPYLLFVEEAKHAEEIREAISRPFILKKPLESYVEKDNMSYAKPVKKQLFDLRDFKPIVFKRDEDNDDDDPRGRGFNTYNSFIS